MERGNIRLAGSTFPVSTTPGEILMKRMPSRRYCALNLATAVFRAALLMAYGGAMSMSSWRTTSMSAMPVVSAMTFFAAPCRIRGMNTLKRCMVPTTLVENELRRSFVSSDGVSPLVCAFRLCQLGFDDMMDVICSRKDLQLAEVGKFRVPRYKCSIANEVVQAPSCNFRCGFSGFL